MSIIMANKKAYLITRSDSDPRVSPVAEILNLPARNIKDGVNLLATEALPTEEEILEYPNLGITKAHLDEEEIKTLKEHSGILAVEEDTEMHILEVLNGGIEEDQLIETDERPQGESYQREFQDFFQQLFENFRQSKGGSGFQFSNLFEGGEMYQGTRTAQPSPALPKALPLVQPIPWNITLVRAPRAWARGITGAGIRVAVIDTGIASHPDLNPISGGVSFVPGVVSFNDDNGHGTHCAGIVGARNNSFGVAGVAPACKLFAVKVLNRAGSGMSSWIIAGMDWAARQGMHVVSMSLGGTNAPIVAYAQAVKRLQDRGTVVAIASGNSFGTNFPWVNAPGNSIIIGAPNASPIVVGAINSNLQIAPFSSRGGNAPLWNQVGVVAPGVNINSTILGNVYGVKSGTSMATPHVAGAAALVKQRFPGISAASVKLKLMGTARDLGIGGFDPVYGAGLIDCNLATL